MHTYQKLKTGNKDNIKTVFEVGFYTIVSYVGVYNDQVETEHAWNRLTTFKHEIQAIALVNFLNGGNQDVTLITDLLKEEINE